jgi:LuxR family maltose regulon positive regulatory protein
MALAVEPAALVIPTKLGPPRVCADSITRHHLTTRVQAGLTRPLTIVCAPGGFGKTTLLATALVDSPWPVAWLSLDAEDSYLPTFLQTLVAAIQRSYPAAFRTALSLLQLPSLPPTLQVARSLQHDFVDLSEDLVLVLDDYHALDAPDVDALLQTLLRHPAPRLHLVVASRELPPWPLARLRAAEELAEFYTDDLRFTGDETRAFLLEAAGLPIEEDFVTAIRARLEGWPAGLRLAALCWRDQAGSVPSVAEWETRTRKYSMQYLIEEIVAQQAPDVQRFLMCTAIVDEFCVPLADALMDWTDATLPSGRVLANLERSGMFISAMDGQPDWYRYHDLFREALLDELRRRHDRATIAGLHRRASAWLAERGHVTAALRHALAGDDQESAAQLVETRGYAMLMCGEWQVLQGWLRLLPETTVQQRPGLRLAEAWVAYFRGRVADLPPLLHSTEALLDQNALELEPNLVAALRAETDLLWGRLWFLRGDGQRALDCANRAWASLPPTAVFQIGQTGTLLGLARQMVGQPGGIQELLASERDAPRVSQPSVRLRLDYIQAILHLTSGELYAAERAMQQVLADAEQLGAEQVVALGHYFLGRVYYAWNHLAAAEEQFTAVVDRQHRAYASTLCSSLQGRALTNLALGRSPLGSPSMRELLSLTQGAWDLNQEVASAFEARLAIMQGDLQTARRWAQAGASTPHYQEALVIEVPQLTRARVLLAFGTETATAEAAGILADLHDYYSAHHNTIHVIEILPVQALAHQAQGAFDQALATLERAIQLAAPGGFVRTFVDLGSPLRSLLTELARRGHDQEYVGRLITAFAAQPDTNASVLPNRGSSLGELIEPLTERELEVLALLGSRLTNKEIADALRISWQTVTKHTVSIYGKLQARHRRDAVRRGLTLGLIHPDQRRENQQGARLYSLPPGDESSLG